MDILTQTLQAPSDPQLRSNLSRKLQEYVDRIKDVPGANDLPIERIYARSRENRLNCWKIFILTEAINLGQNMSVDSNTLFNNFNTLLKGKLGEADIDLFNTALPVIADYVSGAAPC